MTADSAADDGGGASRGAVQVRLRGGAAAGLLRAGEGAAREGDDEGGRMRNSKLQIPNSKEGSRFKVQA